MKRILSIGLIIIISLAMFSCKAESNEKHDPVVDPISDNFRVFYEIFTSSFSDSNNDGIGDLKGIISKLDYLNDGDILSGNSLGVQGIWLTPIFSSPSYHKYDVSDYLRIDSKIGTMEDLKELIDKCHERNVLVILDLPINHTSTRHTWFVRFEEAHKKGDTTSEYYDYYTWCVKGEKPAGRTFNTISGTNDMYEANFTGDMPELNFDNEKVKSACVDIAKYYLDMGVDGFRFDAAKYIYYGEADKNVAFWNWYMGELKKIKSDVYCVGEVWSSDYEIIPYHSSLNCFNFQMGLNEGQIATFANAGNGNIYTGYIANYIKKIHDENKNSMMIPFIANHDTDRAAGFLTVASKRAYMAANLLLLSYGSPFIYYGEEIGMKGTRGGANSDANRRLAMLWGDGNTVRDPNEATYDSSKQTNGTVKSQLEDNESLLKYYMKVISFRNKYPFIARGDYEQVRMPGDLGCFKITYEGKTYYLIHNTESDAVEFDLSLIADGLSLIDSIGVESSKLNGTKLSIGAQSSVIIG